MLKIRIKNFKLIKQSEAEFQPGNLYFITGGNGKGIVKSIINHAILNFLNFNGLRLCAAALEKLNNSASTVQRWRKTAVIGWCGN